MPDPAHFRVRRRTRPALWGLVGVAALIGAVGGLPGAIEAQAVVEDGSSEALRRFEFESDHMGTRFRILVYGADEARAMEASADAFARVGYLDSLFSDYRADSEVTVLAAQAAQGSWVPVSRDLNAVLERAQVVAKASGGAFDVTVGPLSKLWRWSASRGELPSSDRLERALGSVGFASLELDPESPNLRFGLPDMALDLGGIGKGFAADAALAVMEAHGFTRVLVDAGGDLMIGDPPPREEGWLVEIPGREPARLSQSAIATSGDQFRYVTIGGQRYSHVVDPRTGLGVVGAPTVTVIANDATTADALASALTPLNRRDAEAVAASFPDVWVNVVGKESWASSDEIRRQTSQRGTRP